MTTAVDWRAAFDHQVDLYAWWMTPNAQTFARGYMASVWGKSRDDVMLERSGEDLVRSQAYTMLHADPVVVDDDMMTLVENASETFPPEPLREEDLLTPVGFVWFPRPYVVDDVNGKRMSIRAVGWTPAPMRVVSKADATQVDAPGMTIGYYSWLSDSAHDDFADDMKRFADAYGTDLSLAHFEPWLFGQTYIVGAAQGDLTRFMQTLWRLMQQTISEVNRETPNRAQRRRAARAGAIEKYVTVIRLRRPRRPTGDDHEPKHVEWTHRWLVRGHWRQQWFPSMAVHRAIWISPFVKGPEDKPLEVSRLRAFEFVR